MFCAFVVGFQEVYKSCHVLVALLGLIDTLCTFGSLKIPAMFVCDVAEKVLDTELFAQRAIADLNLWYCIYCFAQSGKALTVKRNKHTRARGTSIFSPRL